MAAIDESNVEKKFQSAQNSLESIQGLSLWALSHKSQHEKIVSIWLKVLKSARVELKITLFNLCNEIVQTCRRKHAVVYKDAFKEVLKDAAVLARSANIKANVERIFKIWKERQIYDEIFVKELLAILNCTKVDSKLSSKLLADFVPSKLIRVLDIMADMEEDSEFKRLSLPDKIWDSTEIEAIKIQLKDRQQGNEFLAQLAISHSDFASYVQVLETEMKQRKELVSLLEQGQIYYDTQRGEATLIATAYKNFTSRVSHQRKKLADTRVYLPDPLVNNDARGNVLDSNVTNKLVVEEVQIKKPKYSEIKDEIKKVTSPIYSEDDDDDEMSHYKKPSNKPIPKTDAFYRQPSSPTNLKEYRSTLNPLPYATFNQLSPKHTSLNPLNSYFSATLDHYPLPSPSINPPLPLDESPVNSDGGATPVQDEDNVESLAPAEVLSMSAIPYASLQSDSLNQYTSGIYMDPYIQYVNVSNSHQITPGYIPNNTPISSVAYAMGNMSSPTFGQSQYMIQNSNTYGSHPLVSTAMPAQYSTFDMSKPPPNFGIQMFSPPILNTPVPMNFQSTKFPQQTIFNLPNQGNSLQLAQSSNLQSHQSGNMVLQPSGNLPIIEQSGNLTSADISNQQQHLKNINDSKSIVMSPPPMYVMMQHPPADSSANFKQMQPSFNQIRPVYIDQPEVHAIKSHISLTDDNDHADAFNEDFKTDNEQNGNKIESISSRIDNFIDSVRLETLIKPQLLNKEDPRQHVVRSNLTVINTIDEQLNSEYENSPQFAKEMSQNSRTPFSKGNYKNESLQLPSQSTSLSSNQQLLSFQQTTHLHQQPFSASQQLQLMPNSPRLLPSQQNQFSQLLHIPRTNFLQPISQTETHFIRNMPSQPRYFESNNGKPVIFGHSEGHRFINNQLPPFFNDSIEFSSLQNDSLSYINSNDQTIFTNNQDPAFGNSINQQNYNQDEMHNSSELHNFTGIEGHLKNSIRPRGFINNSNFVRGHRFAPRNLHHY